MQIAGASIMKFTAHIESIRLLPEALASECQSIRFGSEFCELKIPTLEQLKVAYAETREAGKSFCYVTPIVSEIGVKKLREHFTYLKELDDVEVVIGDFGALNMAKDAGTLNLRLGRTRVYIPARSPWPQITRVPNVPQPAFQKVEEIFYQTGLSYRRSLEFYRNCGINAADVDWIPRCFQSYADLVKSGLNIAVHANAIPVTVTEKCHMARFLGEEDYVSCSRPCQSKALSIKQSDLGVKLVLCGNVAFSVVNPGADDVKKLQAFGIDEIVISMNPATKLLTSGEVNNTIAHLVS
jgi:hypothetical protein